MAFYTTASGGGAAAHFEHQDWLGTERMRTSYNYTGTGSIEGSYTSLPFGDGQSTSGSDQDAKHFATLDHDSETDTDHAEYRQYSNVQGRWLRPDPYSGSYDMSNPQSLNRYTYAMNNPLSNIDPSGLDCVDLEGGDMLGVWSGDCSTSSGGDEGFFGDTPDNTPIPMVNGVYTLQETAWGGWDGCPECYAEMQSEFELGSAQFNALGQQAQLSWAVQSTIPNNGGGGGVPWYKNACITGALGSGALSVGIDSIGLIPEAGGVARIIGHGSGYVGVVADQVGSKIVKAVGGSAGAVNTLSGLSDESVGDKVLDTGLTVAGFIPGLNDVAAGLSIAHDIYKTAVAVSQCP